jgi:hypothetical protein
MASPPRVLIICVLGQWQMGQIRGFESGIALLVGYSPLPNMDVLGPGPLL